MDFAPDRLFGDAGNDVIFAGNGNDLLNGGAGNDTLKGDSGSDGLLGGAGNDFLDGGSGFDLLNGGSGSNFLIGGGSTDIFQFKADAGWVNVIGDWNFASSLGDNDDFIQLVGISGVTSVANVFVQDTQDGAFVQWGADAGHLVGGVVLQGVSSFDLTSADFLFA